MARPIWTGSLTFGLVAVPVGMHPATHGHEVSFHQFEKGTADRIRNKRVNERTGDEVGFDDIVKGVDVGAGNYVMLDQDELEAVAPGRSRSLEIHQFSALDEIDPLFFQKTYFLEPGSDETVKTYALLRDAMADAGRAAIGTLVMRGKEYLAAIRPDGDLLVLHTMYFADEVRDAKKELDRLPGKPKAKPAELAMAAQLIDSMAAPWKPTDFSDTYTDRVKKLIKAKKNGKDVTEAEAAPEPTDVTDLFEALRRSVEAAAKRKPSSSSSKDATSGTATSKKAAVKKATSKKAAGKTATSKKAAPKTAASAKAAPERSTAGKATAGKAAAGTAAHGKKAKKAA